MSGGMNGTQMGGGAMTTTERKRKNSPMQPVGRWIRVEKRLAIYLRDSFTCLLCTADLRSADPRDVTLDHIIPKADGGSNKESNLYTCCRACNCSRQDKPLERVASKKAVDHIQRNAHRDLKSYVGMARALLADKTGGSINGKAV
jgi:5-methylcytosine-specific restriction endonuclease McrA